MDAVVGPVIDFALQKMNVKGYFLYL